MMNHKHLFYFWKVAKAGSVARAAEAIAITPQTLSGQIGLLDQLLVNRQALDAEFKQALSRYRALKGQVDGSTAPAATPSTGG